jgi:hypothetical protein
MHALSALKQTCLEALETEGAPGNAALFFSVVDPYSVLDLVQIAETRITDEEIQALHDVIAKMCDYIRQRNTDDKEGAELIRLGRMMGFCRVSKDKSDFWQVLGPTFKLGGFVLPKHKTGWQRTSHRRRPS